MATLPQAKPFDTTLLDTLENLAHRGYTEGFLRRHTHDDYQNYEHGYSVSERQQFVSRFTGERNGQLAAVAVKNKFSVGDSLELMTHKRQCQLHSGAYGKRQRRHHAGRAGRWPHSMVFGDLDAAVPAVQA